MAVHLELRFLAHGSLVPRFFVYCYATELLRRVIVPPERPDQLNSRKNLPKEDLDARS
jgi:hypothetical protein